MLNLQQIAKTDQILLPTLFKSITDNRVFKKTEYRESFVKNINSLLSLRDSRSVALSTLSIFCDHHAIIDATLVTEKTSPELGWLDQLLRIIEQEPQHHAKCFEILTKLIRITSGNPDTNKIVQSKYIQKIVDAVIGSKSAPVQALNCLARCFELHGGTSGIYKNKIYDYCVSFIDIPDDNIAIKAATCLHLLQQSRGGSVAGGVYKKCWGEFHEKNLGSLRTVLEQIMKKPDSAEIGKSEQLQLPVLKLSPEPFNRYTQLFVRFQNLVTILNVSLKLPFPTAKILQVGKILALVDDGITTNQSLVGKKGLAESTVLSLLQGQIHMNLLNVLRSLIVGLGGYSVSHSKTICDILWRCLKQTSSGDQQKFEKNLKLRVATYDVLICFMRISPNNHFIKNLMENLLKETFNDITPANDEIYLMVPQENGEKSGKKKKKNHAEKKLLKTKNRANIQEEQITCAKALEFLGLLLAFQGVAMKPALFYVLQEKTLAIAFAVTSKIQKDGDLYRSPLCRSKLVDLVGFLMSNAVEKMPAPINYGIAILTTVKQNDPDLSVRNTAAMNMLKAESLIHNRKESFYFPTDYRDLRDTLLFNKQTILKFNEVKEVPVSNGKKKEEEKMEVEKEKEVEVQAEIEEEADDDESCEENQDVAEDDEPEDDEEQPETAQDEASGDEADEEEAKPDESSDHDESEALRPSTRASRNNKIPDKRTAEETNPKTTTKKQKVSDKKDDEIVEELFADFVE